MRYAGYRGGKIYDDFIYDCVLLGQNKAALKKWKTEKLGKCLNVAGFTDFSLTYPYLLYFPPKINYGHSKSQKRRRRRRELTAETQTGKEKPRANRTTQSTSGGAAREIGQGEILRCL